MTCHQLYEIGKKCFERQFGNYIELNKIRKILSNRSKNPHALWIDIYLPQVSPNPITFNVINTVLLFFHELSNITHRNVEYFYIKNENPQHFNRFGRVHKKINNRPFVRFIGFENLLNGITVLFE